MKTLVVILACTFGSLFAVYLNNSDHRNFQVIEAAPCEKDECSGLICTVSSQDYECSIGPGTCTTTLCR
jgi:hypothetical protein